MLGNKTNVVGVGQGFTRLEADDEDASFTQAIARAEDGLGENGLNCVHGEPDVIIILRHTRNRLGPDKMVKGTIYILDNGQVPVDQIVQDLNRQL